MIRVAVETSEAEDIVVAVVATDPAGEGLGAVGGTPPPPPPATLPLESFLNKQRNQWH